MSDSLPLFAMSDSLPEYSILQARTLERAAFAFSRGSFQPKHQTQVSRIAGGFLTSWATREAQVELCILHWPGTASNSPIKI